MLNLSFIIGDQPHENLFLLFTFLALASTIRGQKNDIDEIVIIRIADYIMDNTNLTFTSADGRQTFNSTKDIPENVEARLNEKHGPGAVIDAGIGIIKINK